MNRSKQLGVTLLEIMLVLAIAAMVVVMSIRYYQSASTNQKISAGVNTVTGIVAAGESVLAAKGSLSSAATDIPVYMPKGVLPNSPWGGAVTITAAGAMTYTINMPVSTTTNDCTQFALLINQNSKTTATCGSSTVAIVVTE